MAAIVGVGLSFFSCTPHKEQLLLLLLKVRDTHVISFWGHTERVRQRVLCVKWMLRGGGLDLPELRRKAWKVSNTCTAVIAEHREGRGASVVVAIHTEQTRRQLFFTQEKWGTELTYNEYVQVLCHHR